MTVQDVANVFSIFAAIALVVSAVLLFLELRENNRLARASNTESLVALSSAFHLPLIQDSGLAELFVKGFEEGGLEAMSPVERFRYQTMITCWLVFHENVHYQWRQGLLDEHTQEAWKADLLRFIEQHHLACRFEAMAHLFQPDFVEYVRSIAACREGKEGAERP